MAQPPACRPPLPRSPRIAAALLALALCSAPAEARTDVVVVELFQSQGCSSCPPANANVSALASRPDVLALSFAVTYWDKLGWKDTFGQEAFTARQADYARGLGRRQVYTPQVVLNGRRDLTGRDRRQLEEAIARGRGVSGAVRIDSRTVTVARGAKPARPADVWLLRYDPRVQQVPIRRGENGGKTLPHRNIVRELTRLGAWDGAPVRFDLSRPKDSAWRTAVLVQAPGGGPVLAAATD